MEFGFSEEQERFRKEVRDFLEGELEKGSFEAEDDAWVIGYSPEFSRRLGERGWIGLTWPREYGGGGLSYLDRLIYTEEVLRYGAPVGAHWFAERQIGPSILAYGTEEQKEEFLPRITQGELIFGLGLSEPEAGSDLASVRTLALEKDDCYVINGQKVWTSGAHHSDYVYLVVRTDPDAPKHRGISEFIVDMKTPGISVRPLLFMTGKHHHNEVFFDDVRVPKTSLIGEKNRGWYQIARQLDYERSGMERLMSNYPLFRNIVEYARATLRDGRPLSQDPLVRQKLAELHVGFEVGRLLIYQVAWFLSQGVVPNYQTAMAKAYCTEFCQRLASTAMQILGPYGQLRPGSKRIPFLPGATETYMFSPGYTIQAGTSEILRNIIATRGLGLPAG